MATMHPLILAALAAVATAMPSYIAVPADQIAFLDLRELGRRVPRQVLTPPPPPNLHYNQELPPPPHLHYNQELPGPILQQYQREPIAPPNPAPARIQVQDATERPPDFGEYVDFGAHTGDHGAFGWYADYPINNNHHDTY